MCRGMIANGSDYSPFPCQTCLFLFKTLCVVKRHGNLYPSFCLYRFLLLIAFCCLLLSPQLQFFFSLSPLSLIPSSLLLYFIRTFLVCGRGWCICDLVLLASLFFIIFISPVDKANQESGLCVCCSDKKKKKKNRPSDINNSTQRSLPYVL